MRIWEEKGQKSAGEALGWNWRGTPEYRLHIHCVVLPLAGMELPHCDYTTITNLITHTIQKHLNLIILNQIIVGITNKNT